MLRNIPSSDRFVSPSPVTGTVMSVGRAVVN